MRNLRYRINWHDFRAGREDFPECYSIPSPFTKYSEQHLFWKDFFDSYFNANCQFPFIVRILNSFLLTLSD